MTDGTKVYVSAETKWLIVRRTELSGWERGGGDRRDSRWIQGRKGRGQPSERFRRRLKWLSILESKEFLWLFVITLIFRELNESPWVFKVLTKLKIVQVFDKISGNLLVHPYWGYSSNSLLRPTSFFSGTNPSSFVRIPSQTERLKHFLVVFF